MPKHWTDEDEAFLVENIDKLSRSEIAEHFGVSVKSISDKLRRLSRNPETKAKRPAVKETDDPLGIFDDIRKAFIRDFIREIDYRDIAELLGVSPEDLKEAVEKTGLKLPYEQARRWVEIDVGTFKSIADCARCQVQCNHSSFLVGFTDCRECIEQNIKHLIENGMLIFVRFKGGEQVYRQMPSLMVWGGPFRDDSVFE
ncbi:hypothetical protein LLG96_06695 [bacterium]|nr:hypothetical protein [bacterium]